MKTLLGTSLLAALLAGCDGHPKDTAGFGGGAPDVTGHYNVLISGASGCTDDEGQGHYEWVTDWANGSLVISGSESSDLNYEFRDGILFTGFVDGSWGYQFGGTAEWDGADLSVYNTGLFYQDEGKMIMSGEFEVIVDDDDFTTNDCTIEARMEATRIAG